VAESDLSPQLERVAIARIVLEVVNYMEFSDKKMTTFVAIRLMLYTMTGMQCDTMIGGVGGR
jgi:hypothetical protein